MTSSAEDIKSKIYTIRGVQVMLDRDLASLYGVLTKNLNKAVKRNQERFPEDFMFRLTKEEGLRFQNGTSNETRGGSRYAPYAFTENGIAMLSSVLRSDRAIEVNIRIMRERSFVADAAAWKMFGGMRLTICLRMGYTVFVASGGGVFIIL